MSGDQSIDDFHPYHPDLNGPIIHMETLTASDSDLDKITRGILLAADQDGAMVLLLKGDKDSTGAVDEAEKITIPSGTLKGGIIYPIRVRRYYLTGNSNTVTVIGCY